MISNRDIQRRNTEKRSQFKYCTLTVLSKDILSKKTEEQSTNLFQKPAGPSVITKVNGRFMYNYGTST